MKVVLYANTSWYIYNYRKNLISEIQKQGHDVSVISPFDDYSEKLSTLKVRWFPIDLHQTGKNPIKELHVLLHLFFLLRKILPDVLLSFTIKCNLYAGFLSRICRFKQIANISGLGEVFDKKSVFTTLVCLLYRLALNRSKVFFQNFEDYHRFVHQGILSEDICERVPGSGVDLATFVPPAQYFPSPARVFLMFGRIVPRKGYDLFLQAARSIHQEHNRHTAFWILGIQDPSRKDSGALFQKVLEYHDRNIITYFPATDNVIPRIHQSDVIVLPSQYHEGVPRSLLEAMACAKPIITTNWKGCRDTVEHGVNGYLIEKENLASLKGAINYFIQADNAVLRQMGEASRKKVEQEFDEQIVISKYLAEIRKVSCTIS
jgi:glycosyltransferase involved in cell wall biosynthesis